MGETVILISVIILFVLAVSDLIVGVGNDAVNFLNAAIGSKAASYRWIMAFAIAGVMIGSTFSGGMMEIARKGMFYPDKFLFTDVMIIYLAVMFSDVILLDSFNSAGLPTSTTVSMIFELLGAACAVALYKTLRIGHNPAEVSEYINSARALGIVSSILLSVVLAFVFGTLVQYIARILFSFRWQRTYKYFGALWGALSITAITYFIFVKGLKGASFVSPQMLQAVENHTTTILLYSFAGWWLLLQLVIILFKANVLRFVVLFGTFALAMAFAGNDLVNFIGVPLAGYDAYKLYTSSGLPPDALSMNGLNEASKVSSFFLIAAGIVMALTLLFSKKAKTVVKTSVDLSRQMEGSEKFSSNGLSRLIVREAIKIGKVLEIIVPRPLQEAIEKRFKKPKKKEKINEKEKPAFDLVRASVNLFVASALIALGTSHKLPLSTTYVTFMVAMGTAFADRAWGRDSAVYRVSGVITVIGGWFFTAFAAFSMAFLAATLLFYGGSYALAGMVALAVFLVVHAYMQHQKKIEKEQAEVDELEKISARYQIDKCNKTTSSYLELITGEIKDSFEWLSKEKRGKLKQLLDSHKEQHKEIKHLRSGSFMVIHQLEDEYAHVGHYYIQLLDQMKEISDHTAWLLQYQTEYVENNHPSLLPSQTDDLAEIAKQLKQLAEDASRMIKEKAFDKIPSFEKKAEELMESIDAINLKQIKLMKNGDIGSRNMLLITNLLHGIKNIVTYMVKLAKTLRKLNLA